MNAVNYLCHAAQQARAAKTNYVVIVAHGEIVFRGPDLRAALMQVPSGSTLYSLFEPSSEELILASNAGVQAVYFALSKHDAVRLGACSLVPQPVRYAREAILKEYWNE